MNRLTVFLLSYLFSASLFSQSGIIKGKVTNSINKEPITYVTIVVQGTTMGGTSDDNGDYTITDLTPEIYNLKVDFIGFKPLTIYEVQVKKARSMEHGAK